MSHKSELRLFKSLCLHCFKKLRGANIGESTQSVTLLNLMDFFIEKQGLLWRKKDQVKPRSANLSVREIHEELTYY